MVEPFVEVGLSWNTHTIDCCCIDSWFIIWHIFWSNTIEFFQHFFAPIDMSFFWASVKLCNIQREQIFLTAKCSCNFERMLCHITILQYQFTAQHRCVLAQQPILDNQHEIYLVAVQPAKHSGQKSKWIGLIHLENHRTKKFTI